jgi:hypothetical protein
VAHHHDDVGEHVVLADRAHPERPVGGEVVRGVLVPQAQRVGDLLRIGVAGVDHLQRDLARGGDHLPGGTVRPEQEPGTGRGVPAHHVPQAVGELLDGGAGRQRDPHAIG